MNDSIFTKIINGEIHAWKIAEDTNHLAFLDIHPLKKGHTLVVPKKQIDKFFNIKEKYFIDFMIFVYKIAKSIEKVITCNRIGLIVMGFEINHAHVHLVPIDKEQDLNFSNKRLIFPEITYSILSSQISNSFKKISNIK